MNGTTSIEFTTFRGNKDGHIEKATTHREIGPEECLVEITHSGVCATDNHFRSVDMALGHEGIGIVRKAGPSVKEVKV